MNGDGVEFSELHHQKLPHGVIIFFNLEACKSWRCISFVDGPLNRRCGFLNAPSIIGWGVSIHGCYK